MAIEFLKQRLTSARAQPQGFTIFFAMLVGGLALGIGAAIYDLTVRELDLSSTAAQSQYAIYAADAGAECALYWDFKCTLGLCTSNGAGDSAWATSSTSIPPTTGITCAGTDVTTITASGGLPGWGITPIATAATTTFRVNFSGQPYCATVVVAKRNDPSITTVTSTGYNTCVAGIPGKLQRVLQVNY